MSNPAIIEDLKQKAARIQALQNAIALNKEQGKELAGDLKYEAKKLNKMIERHPEDASAAEVWPVVFTKTPAAPPAEAPAAST